VNRAAAVIVLTALMASRALAAQDAAGYAAYPSGDEQHATVAAGPQYARGRLHRLILGSQYRDLWAVPIPVPLLNLDAFAGRSPVRGDRRPRLSRARGCRPGQDDRSTLPRQPYATHRADPRQHGNGPRRRQGAARPPGAGRGADPSGPVVAGPVAQAAGGGTPARVGPVADPALRPRDGVSVPRAAAALSGALPIGSRPGSSGTPVRPP
jgi:hypothetical protein